jgi:O-methyltransferase domain
MLEMANRRLFSSWNNLTVALRTGQPQSEATQDGPVVFAALYADPERLKGFLRAMTGISRGANLGIASKFGWANCTTAADVGTAQGDLIVQVALANPHLPGIGFDLAEVPPIFEEYVAANGLASRVEFRAGNFFHGPLPKADVIMLGHILHDWNLDEKRMLIRKAYDAVSAGGALAGGSRQRLQSACGDAPSDAFLAGAIQSAARSGRFSVEAETRAASFPAPLSPLAASEKC